MKSNAKLLDTQVLAATREPRRYVISCLDADQRRSVSRRRVAHIEVIAIGAVDVAGFDDFENDLESIYFNIRIHPLRHGIDSQTLSQTPIALFIRLSSQTPCLCE